jgi:small subunit ribosomal protein S21
LEVRVTGELDSAIKLLRRKLQKEGVLGELKKRRYYEKPSVKRKNKQREAARKRARARSRGRGRRTFGR